ncbi:hypothetical protein CC78DRAFT_573354 [Lojkania enalia]|uniref:Uncharacterized protein n=1 Tax=Lojkania enalia TaxID=147567 RepID=A0A9P4TS38_9PLEO|nr:hypothetical protein CC78DRAFT_573354 [Didymosphaeria enalia]
MIERSDSARQKVLGLVVARLELAGPRAEVRHRMSYGAAISKLRNRYQADSAHAKSLAYGADGSVPLGTRESTRGRAGLRIDFQLWGTAVEINIGLMGSRRASLLSRSRRRALYLRREARPGRWCLRSPKARNSAHQMGSDERCNPSRRRAHAWHPGINDGDGSAGALTTLACGEQPDARYARFGLAGSAVEGADRIVSGRETPRAADAKSPNCQRHTGTCDRECVPSRAVAIALTSGTLPSDSSVCTLSSPQRSHLTPRTLDRRSQNVLRRRHEGECNGRLPCGLRMLTFHKSPASAIIEASGVMCAGRPFNSQAS